MRPCCASAHMYIRALWQQLVRSSIICKQAFFIFMENGTPSNSTSHMLAHKWNSFSKHANPLLSVIHGHVAVKTWLYFNAKIKLNNRHVILAVSLPLLLLLLLFCNLLLFNLGAVRSNHNTTISLLLVIGYNRKEKQPLDVIAAAVEKY